MKISDDVQALMNKLEKSVDAGGGPTIPHLLAEVLQLFDYLKNILPSTSATERQEIFLNMAQLHAFLQTQMQRLCSTTGLSEEQLLRFSENPDNFSKEQWALLDEVKSKMSQQSKEVKDIMKALPGPFVQTPGAFLEQMQTYMPSDKSKKVLPKKGKGGKKEQLRA